MMEEGVDYSEDIAQEELDEPDASPADPVILRTVNCPKCQFDNHDGVAPCNNCGAALLEASIGEEAVTLATNAIVNDSNNNMGLTWVPVRRTASRYGMIRKKAREMCKTAKRRNVESLIHQWDQN